MKYGTIAATLAIAATLTAGVAFGEEKEIDVNDLPAPVKAAVDLTAKDGKIVEVEVDKEDGKEVYSVEIEKDGKKTEYEYSPDGKLIKSEEEKEDGKEDEDEGEEEQIELSQAPEAVRSAVESMKKPGAEIKTVTKEEEDGVTLYEAEYEVAGVAHSLKFSESGALIEEESGIATSSLPAEVTKALEKKHAGATIEKAEQVKLQYYELDILKDGKKHEVKLNAAGQMMDDEKEHKKGKKGEDDHDNNHDDDKDHKEDKD